MEVKELRERLGMTQQELSAATNIPRARISKWELGKGKPKADDAVTLEKYFSKMTGSNTVVVDRDHSENDDDPHLTNNIVNEDPGSYGSTVPAAKHIAMLEEYLAFVKNEVLERLKKIDANSEIAAKGISNIQQLVPPGSTEDGSKPEPEQKLVSLVDIDYKKGPKQEQEAKV